MQKGAKECREVGRKEEICDEREVTLSVRFIELVRR